MNMTDPIADMLTRIRNALRARLQMVDVPASRLKGDIARILKDEGYIRNFKVVEDPPQGVLKIHLKYDPEGAPAISGIERISRPGRRVYAGKTEIPQILGGLGITIVSTSQGLKTGHQSRTDGVGGEVLCKVW